MVKTIIQKINKQIVADDRKRHFYASRNNLKKFITFYNSNYTIKNKNTGSYWNHIFENEGTLKDQSPMTIDKINTIANSIPNKPTSILDLGIGQGFLEELLQEKNTQYKFEGIDISAFAIKRAKRLFKGKFITGNVVSIDKFYNQESFDLIVALELLEHISPSQLFSFYNKIHKILKDNGLFILSIPINEKLDLMHTNPSAHVRDYTFSIIKTELQFNGFSIEKKIYLYAFANHYKFKKFISKILIRRWKPNSLIIVAKKINLSQMHNKST